MSKTPSKKQERRVDLPSFPPEAKEWVDRLEVRVDDLEAWDGLVEVARALDRPDEVHAYFARKLPTVPAPEVLEEVGRRAADFCEEWFEDPTPTVELLRVVLEREPGQKWAFERLTVLLTATSRWTELLAAYDHAIERASDRAERLRLREEASRVARDFAGDSSRGTDYLVELFLERLEDDALLASLEKRLEEQGRGRDLIRVLLAKLAVVDAAQGARLRATIARKYVELSDFEAALTMARTLVEAGVGEDERRIEDALGVFEKVADSEATSTLRQAGLREVRRIFAARGDGPREVAAVLRLLGFETSPEEVGELHRRALELLVLLGRDEEALGHGAFLVEANPSDARLRAEVLELARRTGGGERFADALVRGARKSEARVRVPLFLEAAELNRRLLGRLEAAVALHREVLLDEAAEPTERLFSTQELCELLDEGNAPELLRIWIERARLEERPADAAAAWFTAGRLAETLGRYDDALEHYAECLRSTPGDLAALGRRIAIFTELSRPQGLVQALLDRASAHASREAERADLVSAARVFSEQLGDSGSAIKVWREVERKFGREEETFESLLALLERAGRFDEAVATMREEIERVPGEGAISLEERLGELLRLHLQKYADAIVAYSNALRARPGSEVARGGLRALLLMPEYAERASEALAETLLATGEKGALLELAEIRLAAQTSLPARERILLEASGLALELGRSSEALGYACRAFEANPLAGTEALVRKLAEETAGFERLAKAYENALAVAESPRGVELRVELARIRLRNLDDAHGASEAYEAALAEVPREPNLYFEFLDAALPARRFQAAARAFFALGSEGVSEEVVDRLENKLDEFSVREALHEFAAELEGRTLPEGPEALLRRRFARSFAEKLEELDSALRLLRPFALRTRERASLELLLDYERSRPSATLLDVLLALSEVRGIDLGLVREAATFVEVSGTRSDEFDAALLEAQRLAASRFAESAAEADADVARFFLERGAGLLRLRGERELEIEVLVGASELPYSASEREGFLLSAAERAIDLDTDTRAVELFERVLSRNPRERSAIEQLARLHERAGRRQALIELRRRQLLATDTVEERLALRLRIDELLRENPDDFDARLRLLEENLEESPGHVASLELLDEGLETRGRFEELCALYEREGGRLGQEPERARFCFEAAGRVAEEAFQDEERLLRNFRLAAAAGGSPPVFLRLGELLWARGEAKEARIHLERRLAAPVPTDERDSRREATRLLASVLRDSGETEATIELLERELATDPSDNTARGMLIELLQEGERSSRLFEILVEGVEFAEGEGARVLVLRNAAEVARFRLEAPERAVPLLRRAIELDREDKGLKLALADALRALEDFEGARAELVPLLEEFGRRRTREKALIHLELAKVAEAKGDLAEALVQSEAAVAIERTDAPILLMVARLARKNGELARAEQAYRTLLLVVSRGAVPTAGHGGDAVSESAILLELSRISKEEGALDRAHELLRSALDAATRDAGEALRLARELSATGETSLLLGALDERLEVLEGRAAADLLVTRARILESEGNGEDAVLARIEAIERHPSSLDALRSTWKKAGQFGLEETCASRFARVADRVEDPEIAAELWLIVARHAEGFDLERARTFYLAASKTGVRSKDVLLALSRVLEALGDEEGLTEAFASFVAVDESKLHPDLRTVALQNLAKKALERSDWTSAVEWATRALEEHADPAAIVALFSSVLARPRARADIVAVVLRAARAAADDASVLLAIRRSVESDPMALETIDEGVALARVLDDAAALGELLAARIELARSKGALGEVRELLVERAEMARRTQENTLAALLYRDAIPLFDGEERVALELAYAELLHGTLGNAELAIEVYERVLDEGFVRPQVFSPLLVLYRKVGKLERAEERLAGLAELVGDEDRAVLRLERAEILTLTERDDEAEEILREIVRARPDLKRAGEVLAEGLFRRGRMDEARELLVELWDEAKRAESSTRLATFGLLFARLFGEVERAEAVSLLRAGLPFTGEDKPLLLTLLTLYGEADDPADRADVLERLLALESGAEARRLAFELARLRREAGDVYGVTRAFELGVEKCPEDVEILQGFVEALRAEDDAPKLVFALPLLAQTFADEVEKASLLSEAAELAENRLGSLERAAELFEKAFVSDSTNVETLRRAVELWTRVDERERPLDAFRRALAATDEMGEADILELRAGYLGREFSHDRESLFAAAADIERGLELFVSEEQAERMRLLQTNILERLLEATPDESSDVRRALLVRLADAHEAVGEPGKALDVLRGCLVDGIDDTALALRVADLARSLSAPLDEATALVHAHRRTSGAEGKGLALRLLDAALAAGEPVMARDPLDRAVAESPKDPELRSARRRLYVELGETEALAESLRRDAELEEEPALKSSMFVDAAELLRQSGSPAEAASLLERALEGAPDPYGLLFRLSELYVELGEVERARQILENAIEAHGKKKSPELSALQHGLSRVARAFGDIEGMYSWLEAALLTDRNNAEVAAELAVFAQQDGRFEVAVKALQMVTLAKASCSMSKPEAYYRQAEIAEKLGDSKKALLLARRAMTTDEGYPEAHALVARLGG